MTYRILPLHLHSTAEAAKKYFRTHQGARSFEIEEVPHPEVNYRPTVTGRLRNHHLLCVEVTDARGDTEALDGFVIECQRLALPVKLFLAFPKGDEIPRFQDLLRRTSHRGIGLVEVDLNGRGHVHQPALSLSLTALRRIQPSTFPPKYRQDLDDAEQTYLTGDPAKGCARVYEVLEAVTRRIALKVNRKGWWKDGQQKPRHELEVGSWSKVVRWLRDDLDTKRTPQIATLRDPLLSQLLALTPPRNQTVHKPKNKKDLIARDRSLRTRFEHAVDTLRDLLTAARPLRI